MEVKKEITFSFTGWVKRADIKTAFDVKACEDIDVSEMPAAELLAKLRSGVLLVNFIDLYAEAIETENEIGDYEVVET